MLQNLCLVLTSLFMKYPISLLFHEDGAIWILCIWSQGGGFIAIHLSSLWVHLYVFSTWSGKKVKNFCMLFGSRITWPKAYFFFIYLYAKGQYGPDPFLQILSKISSTSIQSISWLVSCEERGGRGRWWLNMSPKPCQPCVHVCWPKCGLCVMIYCTVTIKWIF